MTAQVSMTGAASLGSNYQNGVPLFDGVQDVRRAKYHLQEVITEQILQEEERLSLCLKRSVPAKRVTIVYSKKTGRSHYKNVMMCGSIWGCPICSGYITENRRRELADSIDNWQGSVFMGAFTVQHHAGDELKDVKAVLFASMRSIMGGRFWQGIKERYGIVGAVQANEVTWSPDNGWHPHRHVLFFSERVLSEPDIKAFEGEVQGRFSGSVTRQGGYSSEHWGVRVTTGSKKETAEYCFKWGLDYEMLSQAKQAGNGHLTPFELADMFGSTGNLKYKFLFREYYYAFKGSKRVSYSKGLKQRLGIKERKDNELLKQENDYQVKAELTPLAFKAVCLQHKRGEVLEITSGSSAGYYSFNAVAPVFLSLGLRAVQYDDGVVGIFGAGESPPERYVAYDGGAVMLAGYVTPAHREDVIIIKPPDWNDTTFTG